MLGVKIGNVLLADDYAQWKISADRTIGKLQLIFGDRAVDMQHIGSTSIPGIKARPIIDIAVGVENFDDIKDIIGQLDENNFILDKSATVENEDILLISKGETDDIITYNVHVVIFGSMSWINYINFRDYLNANSKLMQKYGSLKEKLADKFAKNEDAYKAGKNEFIEHALRKALVWSFLGKNVNVEIDRPLGFVHRKHNKEITYEVNYGYIPGIIGGDGEELDAYILGIDAPISEFSGNVIAVVHRADDCEDKLVVAPPDIEYDETEIMRKLKFAEAYYNSTVQLWRNKNMFFD